MNQTTTGSSSIKNKSQDWKSNKGGSDSLSMDKNMGKSSGADTGSSIIPTGLKDKFGDAFSGFSGSVDKVTTYIKGKPMITFAAALGVGFLVGTLILKNKNKIGSAGYDAG